MVDALTGRLGVVMMTLAYAALAVLLLAYTSIQIYTSTLMEDVARLKRTQREQRERVGVLTAEYTSLSSRTRIGDYCEKRLGMVQADPAEVVRVVVDGAKAADAPRRVAQHPVHIPQVVGSQIGGLTEVRR